MADEMQQGDSVLIGRCKNCDHWKRREHKRHDGTVSVFGYCNNGVGGIEGFAGEDFCVCDGRSEEFSGEGMTGPMFGCVHFKPIAPKIFNATTNLRWVRRSDGATRLQQGFAELATGELEWRDIPVIQEH